MTLDEAKTSLDLLFSGPPEVGNDRIRIWAAEVAVGEVAEYVEGHAILTVTMKSGAFVTVTDPLRGMK